MVNKLNTSATMNNERNPNGQFVKGHSGFKPKGARSKKKQQRDELLNHIIDLLGESVVDDLHSLSPKQSMKFYINLIKLSVPKLKRIPHVPVMLESPPTKCTYNI